jgi:hypothetical protein
VSLCREKVCNIGKTVMAKSPGDKYVAQPQTQQYFMHLLSSTRLRVLKAHLVDQIQLTAPDLL